MTELMLAADETTETTEALEVRTRALQEALNTHRAALELPLPSQAREQEHLRALESLIAERRELIWALGMARFRDVVRWARAAEVPVVEAPAANADEEPAAPAPEAVEAPQVVERTSCTILSRPRPDLQAQLAQLQRWARGETTSPASPSSDAPSTSGEAKRMAQHDAQQEVLARLCGLLSAHELPPPEEIGGLVGRVRVVEALAALLDEALPLLGALPRQDQELFLRAHQSRLRAVQQVHPGESRLTDQHHRLLQHRERARLGFIHGFAHSHEPEGVSWWADAEAAIAGLHRFLQEPSAREHHSATRVPVSLKRALDDHSALVWDEQATRMAAQLAGQFQDMCFDLTAWHQLQPDARALLERVDHIPMPRSCWGLVEPQGRVVALLTGEDEAPQEVFGFFSTPRVMRDALIDLASPAGRAHEPLRHERVDQLGQSRQADTLKVTAWSQRALEQAEQLGLSPDALPGRYDLDELSELPALDAAAVADVLHAASLRLHASHVYGARWIDGEHLLLIGGAHERHCSVLAVLRDPRRADAPTPPEVTLHDKCCVEDEVASPLPDGWPWRAYTEGQRAVMLGGAPVPHAVDRLKEAFGFAELEWFEEKEGLYDRIARRVTAGTLDLVLVTRFAGHAHEHVLKDTCKAHGVPKLRLPGGYGVNALRHIVEQTLERP